MFVVVQERAELSTVLARLVTAGCEVRDAFSVFPTTFFFDSHVGQCHCWQSLGYAVSECERIDGQSN